MTAKARCIKGCCVMGILIQGFPVGLGFTDLRFRVWVLCSSQFPDQDPDQEGQDAATCELKSKLLKWGRVRGT